MQFHSKILRLLACIVGLVLFTESIRWLDLVPFILMMRWSVLIVGTVVLFAIVSFLLIRLKVRGDKVRFSTRTLLLLAFMVAWPVSRLTSDMREEQRRSQSQQKCLQMVMNLVPFAGQVQMAGRYNDGHRDNLIQYGLFAIATLVINPNQVPFEICYITTMDMTNSGIGDEDLVFVADTQSVSELNLTSTKITDAGLKHLYGLNSLRRLNLAHASVSNSAIEDLKKKLPNLVIER